MTGLRLLIVDDEEKLVAMLADYFTLKGFAVQTAMTGETGLALLDSHQPHLLLLDKRLEGSKVQGVDILQAAKRRTPTPLVLMFSGYTEDEHKEEAFKFGADRFLEKPLMLPEVFQAVQDLLATHPPTAS